MPQKLTSTQRAYLAGFLDGDGSIYVRLKPNTTYRYGFQVAPYIVLFQSSKDKERFMQLCALIPYGYVRERKDGILEYTISRQKEIIAFLKLVKPYILLKDRQVKLMLDILTAKDRVRCREDFAQLMELIDKFRSINYSKRRIKHTLTP